MNWNAKVNSESPSSITKKYQYTESDVIKKKSLKTCKSYTQTAVLHEAVFRAPPKKFDNISQSTKL